MTPKQYKSLAAYFGVIASGLGLSEWDISLHAESPGNAADGEPALASVTVPFGRHVANICVEPDFDKRPREEQRMAAVHELLHVHSHGIGDLIAASLPKLLGAAAYETFHAAYTVHDELMTDYLAVALAPHFPFWDIPK